MEPKNIVKHYEYSKQLFFCLKERAEKAGFRVFKRWQVMYRIGQHWNKYRQAVSVVYVNKEYSVEINFYDWYGDIDEKVPMTASNRVN